MAGFSYNPTPACAKGRLRRVKSPFHGTKSGRLLGCTAPLTAYPEFESLTVGLERIAYAEAQVRQEGVLKVVVQITPSLIEPNRMKESELQRGQQEQIFGALLNRYLEAGGGICA